MQGSNPFLTYTCTASGTLVQYQPVNAVGSAVTSGAAANGFVQVAAVSGDKIPVVMIGTSRAVAGAAITAGAQVEVGTTVSKVVTKDQGVAIGRALTAAAADGDIIEVLITAI